MGHSSIDPKYFSSHQKKKESENNFVIIEINHTILED